MYNGQRGGSSSRTSHSQASSSSSVAQNSPRSKSQPNEQAKRNRDQASKRRNNKLPPDHNRKYPDTIEFNKKSPSSDVDTQFKREVKAGLRQVLGDHSSSLEKSSLLVPSSRDALPPNESPSDQFVYFNRDRLGVDWNPHTTSQQRPQQRRPRGPNPSKKSDGSESDLIAKMFNSVKHLTSLRLSPLPKPPPPKPPAPTAPPPKHQRNKQVKQSSSHEIGNVSLSPDNQHSSTKIHKPTKPTIDVSDNLIQNPQIHSTVQQSASKLWVSASLSRLQMIRGLSPSIRKRIRHFHHHVDPYVPPNKQLKINSESPLPFVDSTIVDSPKITTPPRSKTESSRRQNTPTKFITPTKRPPKNKDGYTVSPIKPGQLPRSPDSTVVHALQPSRSPDSSSVNNVIADFNEYFRNGRELKDRGIEQERIESYLSAFVTFTEAIHHFNMAVYLLVNDLDRTLSLREKNSHKEGRQIANKIEDMIVRYNMPLCNRIRESEYAKTKHSLSVAEQHILDQLAIMCLRCEAKLHMIMHKAQTSHQDHFKTIQNNKELIKRVDEQTETSSGTPEFRESREIRLSREEWKQIKFAMKNQSYLQKAHIAWGQSERMCRKGKVHEEFFNSIQVIADVPELTFYESSLKDLASYQRAIVNKLRDEIQTM